MEMAHLGSVCEALLILSLDARNTKVYGGDVMGEKVHRQTLRIAVWP
jgi:hypothetical protein